VSIVVSKNERFLVEVEELASELRRALERGSVEPPEPTSEQIQAVLNRIRSMERQVREETLPPRSRRDRILTRLMMDEWPLGHPLASRTMRVEDLYVNL